MEPNELEQGRIQLPNRAQCRICHEIIESVERHQMVWCQCGEIAVDGGQYYKRRSAKTDLDGLFQLDLF